MREFATIFSEYAKLDRTKTRIALATVVQVKGSSYRSPGARMLITEEGRWYGSISGGCLEGDALRKARQVMQSGEPMTVVYDTNEGSNQQLGINLGCNGIIDVLLEPVTDNHNPLAVFEKLGEAKETFAVATVFRSENHTGERLIVRSDGEVIRAFSTNELNHVAMEDLQAVLHAKKSFTTQYVIGNEYVDVFIELIQPGISIIIFGGGFDARPVSNLAKTLGWKVSVTDECVAHIAPVFFPQADQLSLCHREFVDRDFDITSSTACILMSHNYEYDRDVLKKIIATPTPYIGILGPRKRLDKMIAEFETLGVTLSEEDMDRIHAPIGLDLGAETAEEIALSIIGEIQAIFHHREGGLLKKRRTTIHERDPLSAQVLKAGHL